MAAERGINPKRTRVGWDVVCRVGDPCSVHDLVRANAHEATSIITMMTKDDLIEDELSGGKIKNGATIRTTLGERGLESRVYRVYAYAEILPQI